MRTKEENEDLEMRLQALQLSLNGAAAGVSAVEIITTAKAFEEYLRGPIPEAKKREAKS